MLPVAIRRRRGWDDPTSPMERLFRLYRNREEDGKLVVDAEMPGFRREEVDVNIDKGVLTITAERKPAEVKGTRHLTERCYTRVERSFTLPDPVDESKVNAKLDDGVLHLELPQTEESKPRRIEVK